MNTSPNIRKWLNKASSLLCACLCFGIFGIICSLGNLIFIPLILCRLHRFQKVRFFARDLVRFAWGLFLWILRILKRVQCDIKIQSTLNGSSCVIIANHPSLLDVVLLIATIPRINCVVKHSLSKNFFLFGAIKASGYILNTANEELLQNSIDALKRGELLLIFPEGTRTKDKIVFHKAASYIALHGAKLLSAIFIKMSPQSLKKDSKWYNVPVQTLCYEISLQEQIKLDEFEATKIDSLRVRALHEYLGNIYTKLALNNN